jgi:iron complex outermembrane receptor protein
MGRSWPKSLKSQTVACVSLAGFAALSAVGGFHPAAAATESSELLDELRSLSLEDLSRLSITALERRQQPLSEAAGSIFVITPEDIRRSGASNLPEALRLAPNLQVGRDTAAAYAISARGFNSFETANKLLVMIDGRSIYTPLYAGVLWDEQHVLLEDLDRIEVLSGPGGALWGANAVNGVVSIVTKNSAETQGPAARVMGGPVDRSATVRYGGRLAEQATFRIYASGFERDHTLTSTGADAIDDYDGVFGGWRADAAAGLSSVTFQGDVYRDEVQGGAGELSGGNVLARYRRDLGGEARLFLRAYYDRSERSAPGIETLTESADLLFQHTLAPFGRHEIIWGGGYRVYRDEFLAPAGVFVLDPAEDTIELGNVHMQDVIALHDDVDLTLGVKFEHSSFSGSEYLPSARLAWTPSDRLLLWAAVSRAVRTPVRIDRDLVAPGIFIGGPEYDSEELVAYEAGYRGRPTSNTSVSLSVFYNDYDKLRTTSLSPAGGFPAEFLNGYEGSTYGVEMWGDYQALDWWRLSAGLATLGKDFELKPGFTDVADPPSTGNDPELQLSLRSRMDLGARATFDAALRWVDELPDPAVPSYADLNARLAWRATDDVELSIQGANLLDESHPETSAAAAPFEARRSVQVAASWRF